MLIENTSTTTQKENKTKTTKQQKEKKKKEGIFINQNTDVHTKRKKRLMGVYTVISTCISNYCCRQWRSIHDNTDLICCYIPQKSEVMEMLGGTTETWYRIRFRTTNQKKKKKERYRSCGQRPQSHWSLSPTKQTHVFQFVCTYRRSYKTTSFEKNCLNKN